MDGYICKGACSVYSSNRRRIVLVCLAGRKGEGEMSEGGGREGCTLGVSVGVGV